MDLVSNCVMWFERMRNANICSQQVGNPRDHIGSSTPKASRPESQEEPAFQGKPKDTGKAQRQSKNDGSDYVARQKFPLTEFLCSTQIFNNWMRCTDIRGDHLFSSVYQFKCRSHPETPYRNTFRNAFYKIV